MQADLGVPVWRLSERVAGESWVDYAEYDNDGEPGIWHPTSPADLAAMRERIERIISNAPTNAATGYVKSGPASDAVMAAIFGSSAT